ncbi:uncharacterized protein [Arachis hypogaea]|uniref:uncharacterized protein n=1 Tax=Arachis hypogaea TaxID=3818 RepID=UPI003B225A14
MAEFLVDVTGDPHKVPSTRWNLHVDGASNLTFGGVGVILESPTGIIYEQSIKFEFSVSNNHAEYEALKYLERVKKLSEEFDEVIVQHVPRESNIRANLLSNLASTKPGAGNQSLIQGLVKEPTVTFYLTQTAHVPSWMDPIFDFLKNGRLPGNNKAAKALRRETARYVIVQVQLFKRGLNQPLLKCLLPDQMDYVLMEDHEGCYGQHIGGKALAQKLVKAGYFWPSMMSDSQEFVKKYRKYQENANLHKAPAAELNLLIASGPFAQLGVDLLGHFPIGPRQVKYLIIAVDYYTKWVEAKPLASISFANYQKFLWRQVIARFRVPKVVISNNETQFADKKFGEFLAGLGIKQMFFSVEHPQTNGQVKVVNSVILQGLKRRLDQRNGARVEELALVL